MTSKHFIALADKIRAFNEIQSQMPKDMSRPFNYSQLHALADFCQAQNPRFKRELWLAYIKGEVGPKGGTLANGKKVQ